MAFCLSTGTVVAQLSPGDLSGAHRELEGMSKCTQCHVLGDKVSNDKCLSCHKEIKSRIDKKQGYHVSKEVKGKDCADCHSDHHGRNFDMIRFDEKNFNHTLAGYELTGAHKKIDCRECHKPDFVEDTNLKKRRDTYLGLKQDCLGCHADYHQKTLSNKCADCHTTEAFAPASKFSHDKTDFPLLGKHKPLACIDCHQKETKNGQEFQRFADVPFKTCASCHDDVHKNNLGPNCKECHNEQGFDNFSNLDRFNHGRTTFPLRGKHKHVDCFSCHQQDAVPMTVFQDRLGIRPEDCISCHDDVHENKFGPNCVDCHNETSFRKVGNLDKFDHDLTGFALLGKHQTVDCKKCHTESFTQPLPHNTCAACHTDYHDGQFIKNESSPDCAQCHTVDGFQGSTFSFEAHEKTKFPLDGAHLATPCIACHLKAEKWAFRNIGERCIDCHDDVHNGQIPEKYYPGKDCAQCHLTSGWKEHQFDHSKTPFALQGAHAQQDCRACHIPDAEHRFGRFTGLPASCANCHDDAHQKQFEVNGSTDCRRCHDFEGWKISQFDHDQSRFKLEGKHISVACDQCHRTIEINGITLTRYKFESIDCIVCHQ